MKASDFFTKFGDFVVYYPSLGRLVGSVNAAILLQRLLYWQSSPKEVDDSLVYPTRDQVEIRETQKTEADLQQALGFGRAELRAARSKLRNLGLLHERYDRINHALYFRVDLDRFDALVDGTETHLSPKPKIVHAPQRRKSSKAETEIVQDSDEKRLSYIEVRSNKETTKKNTHTDQPRVCVSNSVSSDLQTPKSKDGLQGGDLSPDLQSLVEANFQAAVEGGGIKNPTGFRISLEKLARAGELKPPVTVTCGGHRGGKKTIDEVLAALQEKGGVA